MKGWFNPEVFYLRHQVGVIFCRLPQVISLQLNTHSL